MGWLHPGVAPRVLHPCVAPCVAPVLHLCCTPVLHPGCSHRWLNSWLPGRKTRPEQHVCGAFGGIRTPNLLIRRAFLGVREGCLLVPLDACDQRKWFERLLRVVGA